MPRRSARITRGFHRIGVVFAILLLLWATTVVAYNTASDRELVLYQFAGLLIAAAGAAYALCRAVGWIIGGFTED